MIHRFSVGLAVEYLSCFISVFDIDLHVCCFDAVMDFYDRNYGEGCAHVKLVKAPPDPPPYSQQFISDRSKAELLLWFILSVIVRPLSVCLRLLILFI